MKTKNISWIKEVTRDASDRLDAIYEREEKRSGEPVANVLRAHSVKPEVLDAHMHLYNTIMFGEGELTRAQREMIGVVVSSANACPYCVSHHGNALYFVTHEKEKMKKIAEDYRTAGLDDLDTAMCAYAEKLTDTPFKMTENDIRRLRDLGLSDTAVFEVNQVCAYFNYVNRVVHGLGVVTEPKTQREFEEDDEG